MIPEKKYLSKAIEGYLKGSSYFFLTNFQRVTVAEIAQIRSKLGRLGAEFHVIKNNVLRVVAQEKQFPSIEECLKGPTAIVVGEKAPTEVAKILFDFQKEKDKAEFKGGLLDGRFLSNKEVLALSALPSLDALKAQFLCLLNTPAQRMASLLQAVPQSLLNVLNQYGKKLEA